VLIGVIFCLIHTATLPASMAQVTLTSSVQQAGSKLPVLGRPLSSPAMCQMMLLFNGLLGSRFHLVIPFHSIQTLKLLIYLEEVLLPHLSVPSEILTMFGEQGFIRSW